MIKSMTGFARATVSTQWGEACWELRSVNHRYLEFSIRLPEDFRSLDGMVRETLSQHLKRGKIECNLRLQNNEAAAAFNVNTAALDELLRATQQVRERVTNNGQPISKLSATDLLRWPGVLEVPSIDADALKDTLKGGLQSAAHDLVAHRSREGEQIKNMLLQRCQGIAKEVAQLQIVLPSIVNKQRDRIYNRLNELQQNIDSERFEQEMVYLAQKQDVAEELDRLQAHLQEVEKSLKKADPVGRRLDFLMQELNREANTLGSKSVHAQMTQASVNLKVLIEQMREQVQNVE